MRLIDADALIKRLKEDWPQTSKISWAQIVAKCAPTIDAEPVVRCKDCRYYETCDLRLSHWWKGGYTVDIEFCSIGKRREP